MEAAGSFVNIQAPTRTPVPQSGKQNGRKQNAEAEGDFGRPHCFIAPSRYSQPHTGSAKPRGATRIASLLPAERSSRTARNSSASDGAVLRFRRRWRHGGLGAAGPARCTAAGGGGGAGEAAAGGDGGVRP